jgi:glycosyltransferase involved in cell wall biosynthesis
LKEPRETRSQERLRELIWEIGKRYPVPLTAEYIALSMVHPRLGHIHWHIRPETAERLLHQTGLQNASFIVRVYDVTDILFDGRNAHMSFDLDVGGLQGSYYFRMDRPARHYIAEAGFLGGDGSFHFLARSNTTFFDRDRPSGNYRISGLFVGGASDKKFPVENIFDAPIYEKMQRELVGIRRKEALSLAVVFLSLSREMSAGPLASFIQDLSRGVAKFGGDARSFLAEIKQPEAVSDRSLITRVEDASEGVVDQICASHHRKPFHLIHCHDWYSFPAGAGAAKKLHIPVILSLHSTEHERLQGNEMNSLSSAICEREKEAVLLAALVIVPHSSTRRQVIDLYGGVPDKVVIVPDVLTGGSAGAPPGPSEVKGWFGLNREAPMVFFAGEISHAAGADLLVEAMQTICRNHPSAQLAMAGDGPLKGELEARARHAGIGHRCRFLGDVPRETFEALLAAAEFVVIPARTWQDEGLAQTAISFGRPVLTTRQAGINCVVHGQNGLVTFDNPGSIVWGIQELLFNPPGGSMLRATARKKAGEAPSVETAAARHYMYYELVLKNIQEDRNA